ncbi:Nn.00g107450.m01.CDS01 [Neocucurbitaria sp. VM-36]
MRRFVVVRVSPRQHFVYACMISTYQNKGTLAPRCNSSEHAVVHMVGTQPQLLPGELEKGLRKEPIQVVPADETESLHPTSRLCFGKFYPIEWNVEAKDIGFVAQHDMSKLLAYFEEEF